MFVHLITLILVTLFTHSEDQNRHVANFRMASLLSCTAGMVNVSGFLMANYLTTNVTGHFAYFVDEVIAFDWAKGWFYLSLVVFFFLGAFSSNFFTETLIQQKWSYPYLSIVIFEIVLLVLVGMGKDLLGLSSKSATLILLYAMGLQNALVTKISKSTVRTTHLTGLFTDLGIELSQLFFYKVTAEQRQLHRSIQLKIGIIMSFFLGGAISGFTYGVLEEKTLLIAAMLLLVGALYGPSRRKIKQKLGR